MGQGSKSTQSFIKVLTCQLQLAAIMTFFLLSQAPNALQKLHICNPAHLIHALHIPAKALIHQCHYTASSDLPKCNVDLNICLSIQVFNNTYLWHLRAHACSERLCKAAETLLPS